MKPVVIISIAFVLFIPISAFSETDFRYDWLETWEKLGDGSISMLRGIVIDSSDNLYVLDSNKLIKLTTDNQRAWTVTFDINPSGELFLNQNDEIIVPASHREDRTISKYSPSGDLVKTWDLNTFDIDPNANLFWYVSKDENIYVTEWITDTSDSTNIIGTVKKFDSSGNVVKTWDNMGLLKQIDDKGNLYTTEPGKIVKYDPNGSIIAEYGKQKHRGGVGTFFQHAETIIMDSDGLIFATGGDYGPINIIDEEGNFAGIGGYGLGEKSYGSPRGIALDSENTAYITDYSRDKILVFQKTILDLQYRIETFLEIEITDDNPAWIENLFDWYYIDSISYKEVLDALRYLNSEQIIIEAVKDI